jgi:hypothetical protein
MQKVSGVRCQDGGTWELNPETRNHIPVDWNKIRLKFREHIWGSFHQSNNELRAKYLVVMPMDLCRNFSH